MSLHRSATRRTVGGAAPPKQKKGYEDVKQGLKQLHPEPGPGEKTNMDIVFVPGLAAHPLNSWKSKSGFNWISDKEGIARDFPNARILLYMYESAYMGPLKVTQFIDNLASTLLDGLHSKRENPGSRPIVFIGHSMGGLVIAKAVCLAESGRQRFLRLSENIAGCAVFGTPFEGAETAQVAAMFSNVGQIFNWTVPSKLVELMKPGNKELKDLRAEFVRAAMKPSSMPLMGFWEEQPTNMTDLSGVPQFIKKLGIPLPDKIVRFVTEESAILGGGVMEAMGLAANHRDLVKFENSKDERYALVRGALKKIVHGAHLVVKTRQRAMGKIDLDLFKRAMEILDGARVDRKRRSISQTTAASSWVPQEPEFMSWLAKRNDTQESLPVKPGDCLWIRGPDGRGKTSAALAALEEIEQMIDPDYDAIGPLLAFFFCDHTPDHGTAEDLLKSLVEQLIRQRESLASCAEFLLKMKRKQGSKAQPKLTVQNLWQVLQDILAHDDLLEVGVYFVVNNLETLQRDTDSTATMLDLLRTEIENMSSKRPTLVRWLITSGDNWDIGQALRGDSVRLIDLEDEKYGDRVQLELRKHAQEKVSALVTQKNYSKALAYYASSLIGRRAQNTQWIDITCVRLEVLPQHENDLHARLHPEGAPQQLDELLTSAWRQIFELNRGKVNEIIEMLRVLVLTYEDPTEEELGLLTGLYSTFELQAKLHDLVEKCGPLLSPKSIGHSQPTVCFIDGVVKTHLLNNAHKLLGLSDEHIKLQHGMLGLRAFTHVLEKFGFAVTETDDEVEEGVEHAEDENETADDTDTVSSDPSNEDEGGWDDAASDYPSSPNGHIIQLVAALMKNGHEEEKNLRDYWSKTPLHFAANFGQSDIIDELLNKGAAIDDGKEKFLATPLHMAAAEGHVKVTEKLLKRGADLNAKCDAYGGVINAAIESGNCDAVKLLVEKNVSLISEESDDEGGQEEKQDDDEDDGTEEDYEVIRSPLALAASRSDLTMFEFLIKNYSEKLPPREFSKALIRAAEYGRLEAFKRLLGSYEHPQKELQAALEVASSEDNWDIAKLLLPECPDLSCDVAFLLTAKSSDRERETEIMEAMWEYTHGLIAAEKLDESLYEATDLEKAETVELLLRFGACPDATGEEYGNALTAAAYDGTINLVNMLLDNKADINSPNGWALQTAAFEGHMHIVEVLLARGADVNACTAHENMPQGTVIQAAVEAGNEDIVELLLEHGANPDLGGGELARPIIAAAIKGEKNILERLIQARADVNVRGGPYTSTPLTNAAMYLPKSSVQLILDAGADINLADSAGDTPLILAAWFGDAESVRFLLDRGTDVLLRNDNNQNALEKALEANRPECVRVLVGHVSAILEALRVAMASGGVEVTAVVRSVESCKQGLDYNEAGLSTNGESRRSSIQLEKEFQAGEADEDCANLNQGHAFEDEPQRATTNVQHDNQDLSVLPKEDGNRAEDTVDWFSSPLFQLPSTTRNGHPGMVRENPVHPSWGQNSAPPQRHEYQTPPAGLATVRRKPISSPSPAYSPQQQQQMSIEAQYGIAPGAQWGQYPAYQPQQQSPAYQPRQQSPSGPNLEDMPRAQGYMEDRHDDDGRRVPDE
ncbi:hypothetical protein B0T10DRAFT_566417 [Thelonectria olida]|uniref:Nephrocystin 3-like N-terminal domain-containing protein n=1 Tax=Thelonectria olida TaxID=1576542 RepID=A0A9P8VUS3_9HYPO|nr:hypothetical protein B0T10DRAFT_566417 [Thelonectria olida]